MNIDSTKHGLNIFKSLERRSKTILLLHTGIREENVVQCAGTSLGSYQESTVIQRHRLKKNRGGGETDGLSGTKSKDVRSRREMPLSFLHLNIFIAKFLKLFLLLFNLRGCFKCRTKAKIDQIESISFIQDNLTRPPCYSQLITANVLQPSCGQPSAGQLTMANLPQDNLLLDKSYTNIKENVEQNH